MSELFENVIIIQCLNVFVHSYRADKMPQKDVKNEFISKGEIGNETKSVDLPTTETQKKKDRKSSESSSIYNVKKMGKATDLK